MKTAISLPDKLFKKGEAAARKMKVSRSHLYATALAEYLQRRQEEAVTAKLDEVYATEDSRLPEGFRRIQAISFPNDQW